MTDDTEDYPGWDAVTAALDRLYPGVEPQHFGTPIKWRLGGPGPLDGVSFYRRDDHWHLVSYGMSELYTKEWDDPEQSGWGFEFTFRVARTSGEDEPPLWAANFLQALARYVFGSGNGFGPGHHLDLNGPVCERPDTAIRAAAFTDDPELGVIDTPHGQVRFLQVVGLTLEEYAVIEQWDALRLLEALRPRLPLLVTDLDRGDLTGDAEVAAAISHGVRDDGSSTGALFVAEASWQQQDGTTTVTVGANAAARIGRVLAARLPFGRDLYLAGPESGVHIRPGTRLTMSQKADGPLDLQLTPEVLAELTGLLRPAAGEHRLAAAPELTVRIVRSQIRDQSGAVVAEVG
ncbi:suppressor of fused domain protein [Catellatospora sichuanensis]|uniref:suppressor of fused domain protein n=1 Tax=Catellatospora sichuanensis TaxID=1969805 RepID=UPI0016434090|nr:suppressor of fused domain protein [Catellatospora sichuanensis]